MCTRKKKVCFSIKYKKKKIYFFDQFDIIHTHTHHRGGCDYVTDINIHLHNGGENGWCCVDYMNIWWFIMAIYLCFVKNKLDILL